MQTVVAFLDGEEDIAALRAIDTQEHTVFVAQADADDTFAGAVIAIIVEVADDLLF